MGLGHPSVLFVHAAMCRDGPSLSLHATIFACKCHHAHFGGCRAPLADVVLDHPSISLLHAAVYYEEGWAGAWHVADLGSAHGTFHMWPGDDERAVVQSPTKMVVLVALYI